MRRLEMQSQPHLTNIKAIKSMNTNPLTNEEQLVVLKNAYFEALASYNNSYTDEALTRLHATEDAYMSCADTSEP